MSLLRIVLFLLAAIAGGFGVANSHLLALAVALILIIAAFWRFGDPEVPASAAALTPRAMWDGARRNPLLSLGTIAVLCSAVAAWLATQQEISMLSVYLWLIALFLTVLGAVLHDRRIPRTGPGWRARLAQLRRQEVLLEVLLVILMTAAAFGLRAYDLDHYPPFMHGDEGEMGMVALRILEGPDPVPPFRTYWLDHPTLFHYFQAASMALFGKNLFGLRMLSTIFGAACIPALYWIGRVGWGRLAGFAAAWLMAVSHLHIHFSRMGLNNIESVFAMVLLVLLLALAREQRTGLSGPPSTVSRQRSAVSGHPPSGISHPPSAIRHSPLSLFVAAGLVMGLSQYFYYGSRLLPVVAAPLLLFMLVEKRANLKQILAFALATLIAFAPLAIHYLKYPRPFINRMYGVSVFREEGVKHTLGPEAQWPQDAPELLKFQLERNLRFFVRDGDASAFYLRDLAAFDIFTVILFWLGVGAALARIGRYHEFSALTWFVLGLVSAGIITNDSPNAPRLIVMVPSVFLLAGVFVHRAWKLLTSTLNLRLEFVGIPVLVAIGALTLSLNVETYFVDYTRRTGGMGPIAMAREMVRDAEHYDVYLMGAPLLYAEHGVIRFVARDAHARNLDNPESLQSPLTPDKGVLVVALPHRLNELGRIEERFPGGITISGYDFLGRLLYVAYRLPPAGGGASP
ncbi:MAG: ArnT family glycosyltransferase [Anaerolineae bacterium]